MANARSVLPEMIRASRNCGLTNELHQILSEKLTDHDFDVLHRWLQIVEQERNMEVSREKRKFRF